jgi:hypothetical protein
MFRFASIVTVCALVAGTVVAAHSANSIKTIGLYAFRAAPQYYKFWKACGYDTLQFIDHAFSEPKERHEAIYANIQKGIKDAQKAGFKVYVIELSNIACYPNYAEYPSVFDSTDPVKMQERLDDIEIGIKKLSFADGFVFFGGDPGGTPKPLDRDGITAWMEMGRKVHAMVKEHAPKAKYNANIWATAHWDDIYMNPFKVDFWLKEVEYGKLIINDPNFISKEIGIEFPLHNFYRSLAFKAYEEAGRRPEPFPVSVNTDMLKDRGVERMWGWAHFLIDEVDDGYTGYAGGKVHPAQAETRYLHRIVSDARRIGLNGIISNTDSEHSAIEAMNVYAFARFCADPAATPAKVIDEYAGYIADRKSAHSLGQIIRFIENNSTWEASIPPKYRIAPLPCEIDSADEALKLMSEVKPNPNQDFPVPERAVYLNRLNDRLKDIAALDK